MDVTGRITCYRLDAGVQAGSVNDEYVQVRWPFAAANTLGEVADERKARTRRQRTDIDDHIRQDLQVLSVENFDDVASADNRSVPCEDLDLFDVMLDSPFGKRGDKSLRVRLGSVRLIPRRIGTVFLKEQRTHVRGDFTDPSSDDA